MIQTVILNKKKYVIVPFKKYQSLINKIEDFKDLQSINERKFETRIPINAVKNKFSRIGE